MEHTLVEKNTRIEVADVLRGLAVMGIVILHSIEHFNCGSYPDTSTQSAFLNFTDKAIWDVLFFFLGGKAYAVFALLFGFSFYIQDNNQQRRGKDFRLRFMWRLVLLFIIGNFNAMFFTAEILVLYSLAGFILVVVCRLSNRAIIILSVVFLLQPLEIYKTIQVLVNPDFIPAENMQGYYWGRTYNAQMNGNFWQMCKVNLWEGQLASLSWAWNHGRIFQTMALFMLGFVMGRKKLLLFSKNNLKTWLKILVIGLICFFPLLGFTYILPEYIDSPEAIRSIKIIVTSLSNFSLMWVLVATVVLLFYGPVFHELLMKFAPYGRMSLTNYIGQSIIGSFFFYNWGLGLHRYLGITASFFFGIALVIAQWWFCTWWLKRYSHGPFELLWKKGTWIGQKSV